MKKMYFTPALLSAAALLAACGSVPTTTSLLEQTRSDYVVAQRNPTIPGYASTEMAQAAASLDQANAAANANESYEKIDKLAYIAKQKIALTQEVAKQRLAEADVAAAGKERDQIRLAQRTNEAEAAKASAEKSRVAAEVAQSDAAQAQYRTGLAQTDAVRAQRQAQDAQARTAQLESQLAELAAKKTERGILITLGDVLFGTDQARLNADGMRTAKNLALVLQQNPTRTVMVEGFTDSTGTAAHNLDLSERRATAVRDALQEMGVSRERVAVRGYGELYPVAGNDNAASRQMNRRVEIILSDENGKIPAR
jgi:outer membrane protein OmpA-like peptidoglycan-associated protein